MNRKEEIIVSYASCVNLFDQKMIHTLSDRKIARHGTINNVILLVAAIDYIITAVSGFNLLYFIISCTISILLILILHHVLKRQDLKYIVMLHVGLVESLKITMYNSCTDYFDSVEEFDKFYEAELLPLFKKISIFDN